MANPEYLSQQALTLIEEFRTSPRESRSDIIVRGFSELKEPARSAEFLDLGQGVRLRAGETPVLYLSEEGKRNDRPDAVAEIRSDGGLYLYGRKIVSPSPNSNPLQAAMRLVQDRKGHRNAKGEIISLSAWRQWHIVRDGRLFSMFELKDPALAHKRTRRLEITLADLDD